MRESATIEQFLAGYRHFKETIYPQQEKQFQVLADQQSPKILLITCCDSRIAPELVFQSIPGDLFVCRNVGNIVPTYGEMRGGVSAAIEYAVSVLDVEAIVICGHSDCGAMRALLNPERLNGLSTVGPWLHYAETARIITQEHFPNLPESELLRRLTQENVAAQIEHLETHPYVATRLRSGHLKLYGLTYNIETGDLFALDAQQGSFVPVVDSMPCATFTPRLQLPSTDTVR